MAQPSDDVFALGVMAYRLVTDTHPPSTHPYDAESRCWLPGGGGPVPPRQLNARVDAQLNALILRMLSPGPEDRGTAGELAEAMERGVAHAGPSADVPLFEWETLEPSQWTEEEQAEAELLGHRPRHRAAERAREAEQVAAAARPGVPAGQRKPRRWLTWLAVGLALGLWPERTASVLSDEFSTAVPVSLGDTAPVSSEVPENASVQKGLAQQLPKDPLPRQLRPDSSGRCIKGLIALNGGCWIKTDIDPERCIGNGYVYQGRCYVPYYGSKSEPTSAPQERKP
jgi:hypothetical protein